LHLFSFQTKALRDLRSSFGRLFHVQAHRAPRTPG
jgi:hypothetical protein